MPAIFGLPAEIVDTFRKGDHRCKYGIGSSVIKLDGDDADLHKPGEQGVVTGSMYMIHEGEGLEGYLVQFNGTPAETIIMGKKLMGL